MPRKIILDCDPGHDDAVAIMLALASPELEVLGITTVYGNVGLERTTHNALVVLELLGASVPVHAGADRPLMRGRISAEAVHGASGLDGPLLPVPKRGAEDQHAARFIIEQVLAHPGQVTLVPTGALTNIALAMRLEPAIIPAVREVVLMGGSTDVGNWTPSAEFNILCDPEAASAVFGCGAPLVMFGLNLTHQLPATPPRVQRFRNLKTTTGEWTAQLLEFFRQHHVERYGWDGAPIHDACTVAYLLRPELFEGERYHVDVEVQEGLAYGRTVVDVWRVTGQAPNAFVPTRVDVEGFYDLLVERIGRYP